MAIKKVRIKPPGYTDIVHPETSADVVIESATKRFVSDTDKANWNAKETPAGAQAKANVALNAAKAYTDQQVGEMQTDIGNTYLKKASQGLPSGTNLNNVTPPGFYIGGSYLQNCPDGFTGPIFLEVYGGFDIIIQRAVLLHTGAPAAYFRLRGSNGVWLDWLQLVTGD